MSLKDLTHDAHKEAETKPFVKVLFSGNIDPKLYALYLKNQPSKPRLKLQADIHMVQVDIATNFERD